jgi:hypothetical protein
LFAHLISVLKRATTIPWHLGVAWLPVTFEI